MQPPLATPVVLTIDAPCDALNLPLSRVSENTVHLVGRDGHMPGDKPGHWKWVCFEAHHVRGKQPVFAIEGLYEPGPARLPELQMVWRPWSPGQALGPWRAFDQHHVEGEGTQTVFRFGNHTPFGCDCVQIAHGVTCRPDEVWAWMQTRGKQHAIVPTPAGLLNQDRTNSGEFHESDASKLASKGLPKGFSKDLLPWTVGFSAEGTDDLGRHWPAMPVPAFRLAHGNDANNPSTSNDNNQWPHVVLFAGVHPNEGPANWVLRGLVDALVSETLKPLADQLVVDVYPLVNPSGRAAGLNRTTLQHPDRDANRFWTDELSKDMAEVSAVIQAVKHNLAGQAPAVFVDFHSWCDASKTPFGILSFADGFHEHPFWTGLVERAPIVSAMDSDWDNDSTETWAYQTLKAQFAMTFETTFRPDWHEDTLQALGQHMAEALVAALVPDGNT